MFCFSNEFSTFTHKVVYFDFQAGDEEPKWKSMGGENTALTSLEMSSVTMHESLKVGVYLDKFVNPLIGSLTH